MEQRATRSSSHKDPKHQEMPSIVSIIASVSLLHALYSSYEFTHLQKTHSSTLSFPRDIQLEVVLSLSLFVIELFFLSGKTKVLSLVDSGRSLTKSGKLDPVLMKDAVAWDEKRGGNAVFKGIETRVTYIDIVAKRKEYQEWESKEEK